MIYFLVILIAVIVAIFFIPIKLKIYVNARGQNVQSVDNYSKRKHNEVKITINILGFIPVYRYINNKKEKSQGGKKLKFGEIKNIFGKNFKKEERGFTNLIKKIIHWCGKLKFSKLILIYGFNTEDYVKNSYINASLNSIICMIINKNQESFNFDRLYYQVSVSDYKQYIYLDSIILFDLVHNIDTFITIINFIKDLKKEKNKKMRSEEYGRTSHRKFNDDSNELA